MSGLTLARGAPGDLALIGDGTPVSYRELRMRCAAAARDLDGAADKALVLISAPSSVEMVIAYIAALERGHAVLLADPGLDDTAFDRLTRQLRPDVVLRDDADADLPRGVRPDYRRVPRSGGLAAWHRREPGTARIHPDLALLLLTSGSLGTPKAVRLSARNVLSNADAIVSALGIRQEDRAVASLPLHHAYGLSVLNSHLRNGACTVLTRDPPLTDAFWRSVLRYGVTSLAGVPLMYEGWWRTLSRFWPGSLRTATQAGGALRTALALDYATLAGRHGGRFFVMYGQTEATARMSCLDLTSAPHHAGSVGTAIPGGSFTIVSDGEGAAGQVVYAGPNVMMGYARTREDLAGGDVMGGVLTTGDVGTVLDGVLRLAGRTARFTKVAGRRVSLDEFEEALALGAAAAAVEHAGRIVLFAAGGWSAADRDRAERVAAGFGVPPACVVLRSVNRIPTTSSQKVDYARLAALAGRA